MNTSDSRIESSSSAFKKLRENWKIVIFILFKFEIIVPLLIAIFSLFVALSNSDKTYALILNIIAAVLMAVVGGFFHDSIKDVFGNTILKKKGVSAVRNLSLARLKVKNISDRAKAAKNIEEIINLLSLLEKDVANSTQEWTDIVPEISNVEEVYRLLEEKETSKEIAEKESNELKKELEKAKAGKINTDVLEKTINANETEIKGLAEQLAMLKVAAASTSATLSRPYSLDRYFQELIDKGSEIIDEDFLNLPLSSNTLTAYTRKRFKGLPVSPPLQEKLLHDIDMSNYPTLRNIDIAVNRAMPAIAAYKLEASPNIFESGTDYITKALGFVDHNFRAVHGFGRETKAAFARYGSLVKAS